MSELVHVYWDGNTGGWHATLDADHDHGHVDGAQELAYRVTLGRRFIDDHESRDLPFGIMVDENKRTYTLLMTVDDIREVYSDAGHYADSMGEWAEGASVIQAAGRVVEALRKQVPDQLQ